MPPAGLDAVDLDSPAALERAEEVTAAVARALAGDARLHFRAHLLGRGPRQLPSRAPHTRPQPASQTLADLRGAADGVALRVRHSDPDVYARHLPNGDLERLLYEILEQFRVEALAPSSAPGVRGNLHGRFSAWSQEFVSEGLLETDLGLLVFAALQVCRSRVVGEPIEERFNDLTESTRFGLYEVIGPHLVELRPAIHDQESFAEHTVALVEAIAGLVAERAVAESRASAPSAVLAMITTDDGTSETADGEAEGRGVHGAASPEYDVYAREFDRTVDVGSELPLHAQLAGRAELDAAESQRRPLAAVLRRGVRELFGVPAFRAWESEQEEGYLDPRLLTRIVTGHGSDRIYRHPVAEQVPRAAVSILVDCSGSMKSVIHDTAVLVDLLVRALDEVDVSTEVLGYTTGQWSGGRCYRQWLSDGRPPNPGRLNETTHLVFKAGTETWRRARRALGGLLWSPMFREGVDGEAVAWAAGRLLDSPTPNRHLLLVCDGSPRDGATELANGEGYLDRHLQSVATELEDSGAINLAGIGIGHDLSGFLRHSRLVDPAALLELDTARSVLDLLVAPARELFWIPRSPRFAPASTSSTVRPNDRERRPS